ncbi:uncharacterized protein RCO7_00357 [Rhynchosporium graminicola]|uniref:Uncharacterized protein n=1 Tax=Rhynchosporium graminicola TaxID=2792576 RepID=A0A1E1KLL1_9HELO|nr:uncharacterized protein RCO7_00357 [Rhynchosporium commune]
MASFNNPTPYTMPHRASEDTERDSSPHAKLLPTTESSSLRRMATACSITMSPVLVLRTLSFILALAAFIPAAKPSLRAVFKVTVELRQSSWKHDLGGSFGKPKAITFADLGLSGALILCLIIGDAATNRYHGGPYKAGVIVGYFVVLCQILTAVPVLDEKSLTLTARLTDLTPKFASRDNKIPAQADVSCGGVDMGSARRRGGESEEPRQGEDFV